MIGIDIRGASAVCIRPQMLTAGMAGVEMVFRFDESWQGLNKCAVFTDDMVSRDVMINDDRCVVPHEVLTTAGRTVRVGIYGTNEAGDVVVPTVYAQVGQVRPGADPSGDESYPPTPDVVTQLVGRISMLEKGAGFGGIEPMEDDIPKVLFGAALPQTKDDTVMSFRYISKTADIRGYCKTKAQGNSSMAYPKKNQTVKLYKDAACTKKLKVNFKDWGEQNKFCFKANWIDLSHARNIVSARLWGDVVESRANYDTMPASLKNSPNHGAVDGFPVKVYAGGIYQGRYTINIPKDAWMANMDDELDNHCILCGENYVSGCFRAAANIDESDWTDEIHDTAPQAIKDRWNEVISFVMNSEDDAFRANLNQYFDVPSLIDYYLFGLVSCGLDAFGKNQLYMTYDGQKWYASMYDLDSTWGLYFDGSYFVSDTYARSAFQDFADGEGNLLYIRLEALFAEEIMARWEELKNGVLSVENLIARFERFTDIAPPHLVAEDYAATTAGGAFTAIPQQEKNHIQQLRDYIVKRWAYVDGHIATVDGEYFYQLTQPLTLNGTSDYLLVPGSNELLASQRDFTIVLAADIPNDQNYVGNEPTLLTFDDGNQGLFAIRHGGQPYWNMRANGKDQTLESVTTGVWNHTWADTKIYVAVFSAGVFTYGQYYLSNDKAIRSITANPDNAYVAQDSMLILGCSDPWNSVGWLKGTIRDFRIFNRALTLEESAELIEELAGDISGTEPEYFYQMTGPMTFNGESDYLLTAARPFTEARDLTFVVSFTADEQSGDVSQPVLAADEAGTHFKIRENGSPYWTLEGNGKERQTLATETDGSWQHTWQNTGAIAAVYRGGVFDGGKYCLTGNHMVYNIAKSAKTTGFTASTSQIVLGCSDPWSGHGWWKGTIHDFRIYHRALTESELAALMNQYAN